MTALPPHRDEEREIFFPHLPPAPEVPVSPETSALLASIEIHSNVRDLFVNEMLAPPRHDDTARGEAVADLTAQIEQAGRSEIEAARERLLASPDVAVLSGAGMALRNAYLDAEARREQLALDDSLSAKGMAAAMDTIRERRDAAIKHIEKAVLGGVGDRIAAQFPAASLPLPAADTATDIQLTLAAFAHMPPSDIADGAVTALRQALHGTTGNLRVAANQMLQRAYLPTLRGLAAARGDAGAAQVAALIESHLHAALGGVQHKLASDALTRARDTWHFLKNASAKRGQWSDTMARTAGAGLRWQFDGTSE